MQEMIPFVGPHTDIMGPDMGTNEQVMAWFMDTYSVYQGYCVNEIVTGKPVSIGGTEGRREATGRGVVYLIERAMDMLKMRSGEMHRDRAGIWQRRLGRGACRSRSRRGVKVVGISDAHGRALQSEWDRRGEGGAACRSRREICAPSSKPIGSIRTSCSPCRATCSCPPRSIASSTRSNAGKLQCRILAEGANGPTTPEADLILNERWDEIFVIPDILCNAGGVIVSYFEWVQGLQAFMWTETEVTDKLFRILEHSFAAGDQARQGAQGFASHRRRWRSASSAS